MDFSKEPKNIVIEYNCTLRIGVIILRSHSYFCIITQKTKTIQVGCTTINCAFKNGIISQNIQVHNQVILNGKMFSFPKW